jgi:aminopeptidase N
VLDLVGLRVTKVSVVGGGGVAKYSSRGGRVTVRLRDLVAEDEPFRVTVSYHGSPKQVKDKALGSAGWEELQDGVIVAGQPHGAPSWFPCNDRPSDKAGYRITVTAASDYTVVANGVLVTKRRGASASTWVFEQEQPMATYLATVQIGRYQLRTVRSNVPMRAAVPKALSARYRSAFGDQPKMMDLYVRLFGPYPFDSYTVVVTEDELEIPLEAQGLATFGANFLTSDWDSVRLVAHELAHSWFGNSLTLASWKDIWLHEGFACYAEWLWSEECGRRTAHDLALQHWGRLSALDQDLLLADPGPELMFDDRVYKRGALTLHALRVTVGDDAFFALLSSWVSGHAGGSVSTEAFVAHATESSGRDVEALLGPWLYEEPLPELPA